MVQTLNPSPVAGTQNRVSIIGAGKVGSTLAHAIVAKNLADVVLLDIQEGLPQGIALDLMEARGLEGHDRHILGTNKYEDTAYSDVVVITAGRSRLPGMSRDDLIETNAKIVIDAAQKAIQYSPHAVLIVVTNPLDVMTYLAWQATQIPARRVIGMAGVLDASRLQVFIAQELGVSARDVQTMVLGNHGNMMVPLPRYCTVGGIPITKLMDAETITRLVARTRLGGTEIVELMKTGGAYYAPAASTALMVESILLNQFRLVSAAVYLQGEYGIKDVFLGVCCRLSGRGVEQIFELDLTVEEQADLQAAADLVRQNVDRAKEIFPTSTV